MSSDSSDILTTCCFLVCIVAKVSGIPYTFEWQSMANFSYSYSFSLVDFLDLKNSLKDGKIQMNLFWKKTVTNSFLHYISFHQKHFCDSIPIGQFLRLRKKSTLSKFSTSRPVTSQIDFVLEDTLIRWYNEPSWKIKTEGGKISFNPNWKIITLHWD